MELAVVVQRRHARHELPQDAPHQAGISALTLGPCHPRVRRRRPDVVRHTQAIHQLHREEAGVRLHHQLIETHEVRMRDIGETAEFPLETGDVGRSRPPQGLERDRFVAHAVVDRVDDTHPTRTEPAKDRESLRAAKLGLDRSRPVRSRDRRRRIVQREQSGERWPVPAARESRSRVRAPAPDARRPHAAPHRPRRASMRNGWRASAARARVSWKMSLRRRQRSGSISG